MREDFLHYCWQYRKIQDQPLNTTDGEQVVVVHPGQHNTDAGPDFTSARLKIGDLLWAGDVEIHIKSSEWHQHQHDEDPAYNNVILHVVYEDDKPAFKANGQTIPTLQVKGHIDWAMVERYEQLVQNRDWIPCAPLLHKVPDFHWHQWLGRLTIERLEERAADIEGLLHQTNHSWEAAFYLRLMRNFGMKVNGIPFETLARSLPLALLAKHKNQLLQIEALLFGQAGFLAQVFTDPYPVALQREYAHLRHKYDLQPLPEGSWKWLRLRPANFPTIRLAQFAALVYQQNHLFSKLLEADTIKTLQAYFHVSPSSYWDDHYRFDKQSKPRKKTLGKAAINNILINTVVPFVFYYGQFKQQPDLRDKALAWLEEIPPERNHIVSKFSRLHKKPEHAGQTQAMLRLKQKYCTPVRCLHCQVGNFVLQHSES